MRSMTRAVQKIFDAKERPATDPLIVHIAHIGQVSQCAAGMPAGARKLGAVVLGRAADADPAEEADDPGSRHRRTAAMSRCACPSHRVARALMEMSGVPIAAPSANRFSRPSPTTAAHVHRGPRRPRRPDPRRRAHRHRPRIDDRRLLGRPAGAAPARGHHPRAGPVARSRGGAADGRRRVPTAAAGARPADPPLRAARRPDPVSRVRRIAVVERLAADARTAVAQGSRVGILAPEEDLDGAGARDCRRGRGRADRGAALRVRSDIERAGRELFAAIRDLDATGVDAHFRQLGRQRRAGAAPSATG